MFTITGIPSPFPIPSSKLATPSSPLPIPNSTLPKPGPGRPRALDDVKIHQILNLVFRGCSLEQAARHVGCAASTIRREARRNPEFNEQLSQMLLDSELFALNAVRKVAHSHWRAGRWLLERMAAQRTREQNRRPLNPRQLRTFTSAITAALESEIDDRDDRHRVSKRIKEVIRDTNHNLNATSRPKPRRQKRKEQN
jgi:IS30 family transposase